MATSRDEVVAVLRRAGLQHLIPDAERELPDWIEQERLDQFCSRHALTKDWLISRLGGSP
jgi:hypothetical protein